jgi:cellulose synthase/poly-beta-1,6-N-acetylglucosamine synthase-like glycosyltransferase
MKFTVDLVLLIVAVGILIPIAVFCAECFASVLLCRRRRSPLDDSYPRTVVLIPAHDEEAVIGETLTQLARTLRPSDRVLVVADNCTDDTAAIARRCGAEVLQRTDAENRGKPFALQYGLDHLAAHPPGVVVFLDADCRVNDETVKRLSDAAARTNSPVQGLNLCRSTASGGGLGAISELGFRFKNLVRPLGPSRLGLPCHLTGTGMAIPWQVLRPVSFTPNHLAEDMQLGIELAFRGTPARFCPDAEVSSPLPGGRSAFLTQRTRWEQGHLRTMLTQLPRLLWLGLLRGRCSLLFVAADLTVPPLALLVAVWVAASFVTSAAGLLGASWLPAILLAAAGCVLTSAVLAGWFVFCRRQVSLRSLLAVPWYVLRKLPIYARFFCGRGQKEWVRTARSLDDVPNPSPAERVVQSERSRGIQST